MANYANLLATIAANIYTNGNNEVTAAMVKSAVDSMVNSLGAGYQFMGVATPATNPSNPDYKCYYIAAQTGIYTNFGGAVVYDGEVAILYGSGTSWSKSATGIARADLLGDLDEFVYKNAAAYKSQAVTPTIDASTYFDADGNVVSGSGYDLYKYSVAEGGKYVLGWRRGQYYTQYVIAWYDENGVFISHEAYKGNMSDAVEHPRDIVTAPTDAAYAYVNVQSSQSAFATFDEITEFIPLQDINGVVDGLVQDTTLTILKESEATIPWVTGKYMKADNTMGNISTPDYRAFKDFPVGFADRIRWDLFYGGTARVITSDADHNILDVYTANNQALDNSAHAIQYLSVSNNFDQLPSPKVYLSTPMPINEQVEKLSEGKLFGKSVAVLGDSIMMIMSQGGITGNTVEYVGTDGVTYDLDDLTIIGGLLYVTATLVGGEVVPGTTIQADIVNSKQMNMDIESWIPLKEALGAETIINTGRGGATITGGTITTAYPAHSEPTFNTIPNHCLELKRRVDAGEKSPDLIMVWAGTNDVSKFVSGGEWVEPTNFDEIMALDYATDLLDDTDAAMAYKRTFYGGLRFCIEFLSRNFPDAQIAFFSPIQSVIGLRNYERERKVGSYIQKMAERYSLTFVDACTTIGITDIYDNADDHIYLYDGLHPNADGKDLYCVYTTKKINEIFYK